MNHHCGIIPTSGSRDDYPLLQATCRLTVTDVNAYAVLSQTYACVGRGPEEVTYVFPLPSDAAVSAFSAGIDKTRIIRGVVKERAVTRQDEVNDTGDWETTLANPPSSQVFEASLGPLCPGQTVVVNIEFVFAIAETRSMDSLRLQLPVTLAPSCGTLPEAMKSRLAAASSAGSRFKLSAYFEMTGTITSIDSPTHSVDVEHDGGTTAFVTIWSDKLLESDIVLDVKCDDLNAPRCVMQRFAAPESDTATDAFALRLVPYFDPSPVPSQEYLILVDGCGRSDAIRGALHILLHSLPIQHTRVNVFSSGAQCSSRWPASVEYTAKTLKAGIASVDAMLTERGAIDIAEALRMVVGSRKQALKRPAVVLLVTDRGAGDAKIVMRVVTDAVAESDFALRFSVLGVGNDVSTEMCDGIASAGGGTAFYVRENESPDAKLVNLFVVSEFAPVQHEGIEWIVSPDEDQGSNSSPADELEEQAKASAFSRGSHQKTVESPRVPVPDDNTVTQHTACLQQAPNQLGTFSPFHSNRPCSVFALVQRPRDAPIPTGIALKGTSLGQPVQFDIPVAHAPYPMLAQDRAPFLHVLAARALVQELEDKDAAALCGADKEQIARLGTTYGIISSQTSYVTVDEGGELVNPSAQNEVQSYGLLRLTCSANGKGGNAATAAPIHRSATVGPGPIASRGPTSSSSTQRPTGTSSDVITLSTVALMQQFDGSFPDITPLKLSRTLECPKKLLVKDTIWNAAKDKLLKTTYNSKDRLWNTILTLAFLERRFRSSEERKAWVFIGAKARNFARETLLKKQEDSDEDSDEDRDEDPPTLEEWLAYAAEALFQRRPIWTVTVELEPDGIIPVVSRNTREIPLSSLNRQNRHDSTAVEIPPTPRMNPQERQESGKCTSVQVAHPQATISRLS